MSDLISRSALISKVKTVADYDWNDTRRKAYKEFLDMLINAREMSYEHNEKSRLLDAKEIIRIAESEFDENDMFKIRWLIAHTPTAYDVSKVVAELEEETECPNCSMYCADAHICGFDEMRKQAIDIVQEVAEEYNGMYVFKEEVGYMLDSIEMRGDETWMDYYRKALIGLCELNDEEYKNGWIPVSERLPEEGEDVLVWYEYFRYGNFNRLYQTIGISYTYRGEWSGFVNGSSGWRDLRIIAWQPLPEPFKERDKIE